MLFECNELEVEGNGPCRPPDVDLDCSGLPCTPWSPVGARMKEEDPVTEVHLKWSVLIIMIMDSYNWSCVCG